MSSNQRQVLKNIFCINFLLPRRWSVCIRHCITWPPLFLLSLFQNWTSRVLKNKWLSPWRVQLQRRWELPQDCLKMLKVEFTADAPPRNVCSSCRARSTGGSGEMTWATLKQRSDHAPRASWSRGNTLQGRL